MPAAPTLADRAPVWRLVACCRWLLLAAGLIAAGLARADAAVPDGGCLRVPFAQQVDVDTVNALALASPQSLLARIAALGVDLKRVPSVRPVKPLNPLLAGLPPADERLLLLAEFRDSYEGRSIPAGADCCGLAHATVLIRDTASTYTLLHEVVHLLLVPADGVVLRTDLETQFAVAFHRLNTYQRRLYDDPWRLLDPLWRRDIAQALREVSGLLFDRLRIGQSQEAIVEKLLAGCISESSPYFDATRRAEGRRYAEAMIDNAVDVFNTLNAALVFCEDAVRQLHADLAAGRLPVQGSTRLSDADQQAFTAELRGVHEELARVRGEIEALKRFHTR